MKSLPLLSFLAATPVAVAQAQTHDHHGMSAVKSSSPHASPAVAGLAPGTPAAAFHRQMDSVMTVMDRGMQQMGGVPPTNIDASFAAMMVPHHQGAVDMARLQLLYGQDPALRRLAQSIIAEQQVEIQQMNAWLRQHGAAAKPSSAPAQH
ncbi:DUF305 domain-containing protein [Hymenobacter wooponensis]|uniref:DUF305 domain-containing protein n=1 Tax=Hymenobacter wooponensis TaxID=1525360 RepID=A0A4Z0MDW5_9BACT|nr:DUF305 domain-containing protein [Hymenobacter wooponensis]TGD77547.1 DUF305 domain-containing protein [Hymenobacter wooponensis]